MKIEFTLHIAKYFLDELSGQKFKWNIPEKFLEEIKRRRGSRIITKNLSKNFIKVKVTLEWANEDNKYE